MNEYPTSQRQPPNNSQTPPNTPPKREADSSDCADPGETPCPEPKPCPPQPKRPCPPPTSDTCDAPAPAADDATAATSPEAGETDTNGESARTPASTPAEQLNELRRIAEREERELQKFEPLKAKLSDVTARIASLEKLIDGQAKTTADYTDFYRAIELLRSALDCSIPTIRCQLTLTDKQKQCIRKAIATVDARVKRARSASDAHNADVARLDQRQKKLDGDLAWAKKWKEFFETTLQTQIAAQRDDLKALQALADPSKDQCEVWFYLSEMEALLRSARTNGDGEACYRDDLNVATFLDCWSVKCYTTAYQYWIVAFNNAESASKVGQIELDEAKKRADELDKAADEAESKRRDWVLKELKAQDCCGPSSKCP
jgi:hypothetical protein